MSLDSVATWAPESLEGTFANVWTVADFRVVGFGALRNSGLDVLKP